MKQKDVALIIVIAAIASMISFFVARALFASPDKRSVSAEMIDPITTDFPQPDKKYFNEQSINPTRQISIGDTSNESPFNGVSE